MATTRALNRNVPYLKQQFSALLKNTSPVITFICGVTTCGYFLSFSETAVRVLSVTPGYILPPAFWIWTAFTFCFIEFHFWEVLIDVVTVGLCGKLIEPLWGQLEMFIFFGIVNLGVAILTAFYYLFVYMCTKNSEILFDIHIHGLTGYVAAVSVAVRQIMPDHLIAKTRLGKFTNRNVPLSVLFVSLILWAINLLDGTHPAMFCAGLLVSWVYLRFYQRHPNGRGDSSESFTFSSFFPNVLQPAISILVNPIYQCCLRIGCVRPPAPPRTSSTASLTSVTVSIPGVDPHDIERRRQIALKALSERLKTTDTNRQHSLPKSFPQTGKQHHHHHGAGGSHHSHGPGGHNFGHHSHHHPGALHHGLHAPGGIPMAPTTQAPTHHAFVPHPDIAIPLGPPPSMATSTPLPASTTAFSDLPQQPQSLPAPLQPTSAAAPSALAHLVSTSTEFPPASQ